MSTLKKVLMIHIKVLFGFIMNTSLKQCRKVTLNALGHSAVGCTELQYTHCGLGLEKSQYDSSFGPLKIFGQFILQLLAFRTVKEEKVK